jgi:diguanylate cyclase (GGDEF)-like protein/PAS domain S-box-containing protein
MDEALKKREVQLNEMGRTAKVGGWEFDTESEKQVWTKEVYRIHEVDENYEPTVNKGIEFYLPASRPVIEKAVQRAIEHGEPFDVELEIMTAKGNHRWVHATGNAHRENGITKKVSGIFQDITESKREEEALRESEKRFMDVFYNSEDAILLIDGQIFVDCNEATTQMLGYSSRNDFLMTHPSKLSPPAQPDGKSSFEKANEMMRIASEKGFHRFEWMHQKVNGENFPVEVSLTPIALHGKSIIYCVWRDVTDRKLAEEKIQQLVYHDTLTGLPNRRLFSDRLYIALAQAQRNKNKVGVVMLDLDKFKDVNDTLGHDVGDLLLKATAERLSAALRKGDTVARFGGDEFVLILPDLEVIEDATQVAQKIVDSFCKPFLIGAHQLIVTTSIGIAVYPIDGTDEGILLKNADIAMYKAKQAGRGRYQLYNRA